MSPTSIFTCTLVLHLTGVIHLDLPIMIIFILHSVSSLRDYFIIIEKVRSYFDLEF